MKLECLTKESESLIKETTSVFLKLPEYCGLRFSQEKMGTFTPKTKY